MNSNEHYIFSTNNNFEIYNFNTCTKLYIVLVYMRPQWANGQTHHHQKGCRNWCRCCNMFGTSRNRRMVNVVWVTHSIRRMQQRSNDLIASLDRTIYDKITCRMQYGDKHLW